MQGLMGLYCKVRRLEPTVFKISVDRRGSAIKMTLYFDATPSSRTRYQIAGLVEASYKVLGSYPKVFDEYYKMSYLVQT